MTTVEGLICPRPLDVPGELAAPTPGYRRRVALAFLALVSFIAVYGALTGWFVWAACRIGSGAFNQGPNAGFGFFGAVERGHAYVLGAVILGHAAPESWRAEARALLSAQERPFL